MSEALPAFQGPAALRGTPSPMVSSHTQETKLQCRALGWESRDLDFTDCVTPRTVLFLSEPLLNEHHSGSNLGALNGKHPGQPRGSAG